MNRVVHCKRNKYDIYIGRPSKWGNPFLLGVHGNRDKVIDLYEKWLLGIIKSPNNKPPPSLDDAKKELSGKVLGCYCAPKKCHGDILVKFTGGDNE